MVKIKTTRIINFLNNVKKNIFLIFFFTLLSSIISISAGISDSSGHGGFLILTYPLFISVITVIIYLTSRLFFKEYNWIITIIGIIYNVYESIGFH